MLAPPWITVPPPGYGGIEEVIDVLCRELGGAGHRVTLFAAPGSRCDTDIHALLDAARPHDIGQALYEADHVSRAFVEIDSAAANGDPFDVVHDHSGFTALAFADRLTTPVVHTLHGAFTAETWRFYAAHGHKALITAISAAQRDQGPPSLRAACVIPNPLDVDAWEFSSEKANYLLWVGRVTEEKGPHRAIAVARATGRQLVLAGPVQPGHERFFAAAVKPHIDGVQIRYVGEVRGAAKRHLFRCAAGLLMPIRWPEPFGMVMIEALVGGTPVIAYPEGSAPEIIDSGTNGYLVDGEDAMAAAVARLPEIDPLECRRSVASRYDGASVAERYVRVYREAIGAMAAMRVKLPARAG